MSAASIDALERCRSGLRDIASTPLDVARHAGEISEETGVARELIAQLREAEERRAYLEGRMAGAKDLPNKMEYSNAVDELSVDRIRADALGPPLHPHPRRRRGEHHEAARAGDGAAGRLALRLAART